MGVARSIITIVIMLLVVTGIILLIFDGNIQKMKEAKANALNKVGGSKNKGKNENNKINNGKKEKKSNTKNINIKYTDDFLDFEDIEIYSKDEPIGLIVRENKNEFSGIIQVHGINYNLLSIDERLLLEQIFGQMFNGIDYPIEIYVTSKSLDIDHYNRNSDKRIEEIKNEIENNKRKIDVMLQGNINSKEIEKEKIKLNRLIKQYEYGLELSDYQTLRCTAKTMLNRNYYIVITYSHNKTLFQEELTYDELIGNAFNDILNKSSNIISSLSRGKLQADLLEGVQIAELIYSSYSKSDSEKYKLRNALESKFSHFFTTAEPIEAKLLKRKLELLEGKMQDDVDEYNKMVTPDEKVGA